MTDDDIAEKMWNALVTTKRTEQTPITIPLTDQKKFIERNINALTVKDRRDVGNVIIINGLESKFKEGNEGLMVDLNVLPASVITQMYELTIFKLGKSN